MSGGSGRSWSPGRVVIQGLKIQVSEWCFGGRGRKAERKMSEEDGSASFSLSFRTSSALRPEATATFKMIRPFALHSLSGETPQPRSR